MHFGMKVFFLVTMVFFALPAVTSINYYEFTLLYRNGTYDNSPVIIKPFLEEAGPNPSGRYRADVASFDGQILNRTYFGMNLFFTYDTEELIDGGRGGGIVELTDLDVLLKVPYFSNAKEINIYDLDRIKQLTIDVSEYSEEVAVVIPESDQETEAMAKQTVTQANNLNFNVLLLILAVIVLLLFVVLVYLRRTK